MAWPHIRWTHQQLGNELPVDGCADPHHHEGHAAPQHPCRGVRTEGMLCVTAAGHVRHTVSEVYTAGEPHHKGPARGAYRRVGGASTAQGLMKGNWNQSCGPTTLTEALGEFGTQGEWQRPSSLPESLLHDFHPSAHGTRQRINAKPVQTGQAGLWSPGKATFCSQRRCPQAAYA